MKPEFTSPAGPRLGASSQRTSTKRRTFVKDMGLQTRISNVGLLLLFPGFFLWHFALAVGVVPFDVGLYGLVSAVIAACFLTVFVTRWAHLVMRSHFALTAIGFIVYCLIWTLAHMIGNTPPGAALQVMAAIVSWFALLSAGAFMQADQPTFKITLIIACGAMVAIVLGNLDGLYFNARSLAVSDKGVASYQGFARSMMVSSILVLAFIDTTWKRIVLSMASVLIVFLMMARAELYGMIIAILAVEGVYAVRRGTRMALLMVAVASFSFLVVINLEFLMSSRQMQILNLSESTSWLARQEAQRIALVQIGNNPIMGVFGGHYYADTSGGLGNYSHNALSAWVSFGLLGFLVYVGLTVWATVGSLMMLLRTGHRAWRLPAYLNVSAFVLIVFAKPVFWPVVALGWGVYIGTSRLLRYRG